MGWFNYSPLLWPKDTELRAPSVPKAKLGHTKLRALSGYLTPSNSYIGFPIIPLLGPKHTEPCATSVPKAMLGHTEPRVPSVPKAKLGHSNHMS